MSDSSELTEHFEHVDQLYNDSSESETEFAGDKRNPKKSSRNISGSREHHHAVAQEEPEKRSRTQDLEEQDESEEIPRRETELARQLKTLCSHLGGERPDTLLESANILLELGKLYLEKAQTLTRMPRKCAFIRSCALLNGAKVRFKRLEEKEKVEEVDSLLLCLGGDLLQSASQFGCPCANTQIDMCSISASVSERLGTMRKNLEKQTTQIPEIPDDLHGDELRQLEEMKIQAVKELMTKSTTDYKLLLDEIATECKKWLGFPPCSFAQVGLGSLARGEITLYSDLEHVILLDDEAERHDERILEYFRWYTVLFQVIIIGLGETYIRSVGVPSINKLDSENPWEENWFFDHFTPSGISFDGTAPHASMTPLGRSATSGGKEPIEFIQPVSHMVKFLTVEGGKKAGYNVREILSCLCFVHGEVSIYEKVLEQSKTILGFEDSLDQADRAMENIRHNRNKNVSTHTHEVSNPKQSIYRPATVLVASVGQMFGVSQASCISMTESLSENEVINENARHSLKYALAVASEIRMKIYFKRGQQRVKMTRKELFHLVGKKSAIDMMMTLESLKLEALRLKKIVQRCKVNCEDHSTHVTEMYKSEDSLKKLVKLMEFYDFLLNKADYVFEDFAGGLFEDHFSDTCKDMCDMYDSVSKSFAAGETSLKKGKEKEFFKSVPIVIGNTLRVLGSVKKCLEGSEEQQESIEDFIGLCLAPEAWKKKEANRLRSDMKERVFDLEFDSYCMIECLLRFGLYKEVIEFLAPSSERNPVGGSTRERSRALKNNARERYTLGLCYLRLGARDQQERLGHLDLAKAAFIHCFSESTSDDVKLACLRGVLEIYLEERAIDDRQGNDENLNQSLQKSWEFIIENEKHFNTRDKILFRSKWMKKDDFYSFLNRTDKNGALSLGTRAMAKVEIAKLKEGEGDTSASKDYLKTLLKSVECDPVGTCSHSHFLIEVLNEALKLQIKMQWIEGVVLTLRLKNEIVQHQVLLSEKDRGNNFVIVRRISLVEGGSITRTGIAFSGFGDIAEHGVLADADEFLEYIRHLSIPPELSIEVLLEKAKSHINDGDHGSARKLLSCAKIFVGGVSDHTGRSHAMMRKISQVQKIHGLGENGVDSLIATQH